MSSILHLPFPFFSLRLFFEQFTFVTKLRGKYRDFPYIVSSIISNPHQTGTFVTMGEPTLKQYNHPKSIVYITVHSCEHSIGLGKCITTCSHHYIIVQSIFTALNMFCALPFSPRQSLIFYCLHGFAFSRMPYSWNHIVYSLFMMVSFSDNSYLWFFHVFLWLESLFLLVLNNNPLSRCNTVYYPFT